jgi:hypothetical protein
MNNNTRQNLAILCPCGKWDITSPVYYWLGFSKFINYWKKEDLMKGAMGLK